jgi:hypothetical protein
MIGCDNDFDENFTFAFGLSLHLWITYLGGV